MALNSRRRRCTIPLQGYTRGQITFAGQPPNPLAEIGILKPRRLWAVTYEDVPCLGLYEGRQRSGRRYKFFVYQRESSAQRRAQKLNEYWKTNKFAYTRIV